MFAIVQVGSKQYKIAEGDSIEAYRLSEEEAKDVTLDKVLFFSNGEDVRIGQPYLQEVTVSAKVIDHTLDGKKIAFKYRKRKSSALKKGHRQKLTRLNIQKIAVS